MRSVPLTGVVMVEGRPCSEAVVEVKNPAGDVLSQVQVDTEGRFIFYLTPGNWVLDAWDRHGHRGDTGVTLEPDAGRPVFIDLEEH